MVLGVWGGLIGRALTKMFELDILARAAARERRALEMARELDAAEVGRRADARRARRQPGERANSAKR